MTHPPPPPPRRFTHAAALAEGGDASQAPPKTTAAIAAPDHFPMLWRNRRRSSSSLPFSLPVASGDFSSFIHYRSRWLAIAHLWFPASRHPSALKSAWQQSATYRPFSRRSVRG